MGGQVGTSSSKALLAVRLHLYFYPVGSIKDHVNAFGTKIGYLQLDVMSKKRLDIVLKFLQNKWEIGRRIKFHLQQVADGYATYTHEHGHMTVGEMVKQSSLRDRPLVAYSFEDEVITTQVLEKSLSLLPEIPPHSPRQPAPPQPVQPALPLAAPRPPGRPAPAEILSPSPSPPSPSPPPSRPSAQPKAACRTLASPAPSLETQPAATAESVRPRPFPRATARTISTTISSPITSAQRATEESREALRSIQGGKTTSVKDDDDREYARRVRQQQRERANRVGIMLESQGLGRKVGAVKKQRRAKTKRNDTAAEGRSTAKRFKEGSNNWKLRQSMIDQNGLIDEQDEEDEELITNMLASKADSESDSYSNSDSDSDSGLDMCYSGGDIQAVRGKVFRNLVAAIRAAGWRSASEMPMLRVEVEALSPSNTSTLITKVDGDLPGSSTAPLLSSSPPKSTGEQAKSNKNRLDQVMNIAIATRRPSARKRSPRTKPTQTQCKQSLKAATRVPTSTTSPTIAPTTAPRTTTPMTTDSIPRDTSTTVTTTTDLATTAPLPPPAPGHSSTRKARRTGTEAKDRGHTKMHQQRVRMTRASQHKANQPLLPEFEVVVCSTVHPDDASRLGMYRCPTCWHHEESHRCPLQE